MEWIFILACTFGVLMIVKRLIDYAKGNSGSSNWNRADSSGDTSWMDFPVDSAHHHNDSGHHHSHSDSGGWSFGGDSGDGEAMPVAVMAAEVEIRKNPSLKQRASEPIGWACAHEFPGAAFPP